MDPKWMIVLVQIGSMILVALVSWAGNRSAALTRMNGFADKLDKMHEQILSVVASTETHRKDGETRLNTRLDSLESKIEAQRQRCDQRLDEWRRTERGPC
jgi:hypothetical protein